MCEFQKASSSLAAARATSSSPSETLAQNQHDLEVAAHNHELVMGGLAGFTGVPMPPDHDCWCWLDEEKPRAQNPLLLVATYAYGSTKDAAFQGTYDRALEQHQKAARNVLSVIKSMRKFKVFVCAVFLPLKSIPFASLARSWCSSCFDGLALDARTRLNFANNHRTTTRTRNIKEQTEQASHKVAC